jgi:hypothetical protein
VPWRSARGFVVLLQRFPSFRNLAEANHTETALLLALASIASGLLVEDIGSRIESRWFDKQLVKQPSFSHHDDEWDQYLRLTFSIEPVGQRYLRTILLRFNRGCATALVPRSILDERCVSVDPALVLGVRRAGEILKSAIACPAVVPDVPRTPAHHPSP